jgi:hypothetical protein
MDTFKITLPHPLFLQILFTIVLHQIRLMDVTVKRGVRKFEHLAGFSRSMTFSFVPLVHATCSAMLVICSYAMAVLVEMRSDMSITASRRSKTYSNQSTIRIAPTKQHISMKEETDQTSHFRHTQLSVNLTGGVLIGNRNTGKFTPVSYANN